RLDMWWPEPLMTLLRRSDKRLVKRRMNLLHSLLYRPPRERDCPMTAVSSGTHVLPVQLLVSYRTKLPQRRRLVTSSVNHIRSLGRAWPDIQRRRHFGLRSVPRIDDRHPSRLEGRGIA